METTEDLQQIEDMEQIEETRPLSETNEEMASQIVDEVHAMASNMGKDSIRYTDPDGDEVYMRAYSTTVGRHGSDVDYFSHDNFIFALQKREANGTLVADLELNVDKRGAKLEDGLKNMKAEINQEQYGNILEKLGEKVREKKEMDKKAQMEQLSAEEAAAEENERSADEILSDLDSI